MNAAGYRLIDHTADFGIKIFGRDAIDLYRNAALALADLLVRGSTDRPSSRRDLRIQGADPADLMVNWLRELLYLWNGYQRITVDVDIRELYDHHLNALVTLSDFDPQQHHILHEIKAVTYHQVAVEQGERGWWARVIFDV